MKRVWIAAVLILLVNLISGYGLFRIATIIGGMDGVLAELELATEQKEIGQAEDLTVEFLSQWEEKHETLERYIHHEALDSITRLSARLPSLAKYEDYDRLAAETVCIRTLLRHAYDAEIPTLSNIF